MSLSIGSPFIQEIDELVSPTAGGTGLVKGKVGIASTFTVDGRGFPGRLSCNVDGTTTLTPVSEITCLSFIHIPQYDSRTLVHTIRCQKGTFHSACVQSLLRFFEGSNKNNSMTV